MSPLILLLSFTAISTQAPAPSPQFNDDTTNVSANITTPTLNRTGATTDPVMGADALSKFECYRPPDWPAFRLDDCMIPIGDGLSLFEYEKPRWFGTIPGSVQTPKYWHGTAPREGYCKLKLFPTQENPRRGPKPAKFSYADVEELERMIIRHCQYRMGGQVYTAGGRAPVYMKDPIYRQVETVFDVALYGTGKNPTLGAADGATAAGNATASMGNALTPTENAMPPTNAAAAPLQGMAASA